MQRGRALFEHTKHTPEMKARLADTFDKIVEAIEQDCPEMDDHHLWAISGFRFRAKQRTFSRSPLTRSRAAAQRLGLRIKAKCGEPADRTQNLDCAVLPLEPPNEAAPFQSEQNVAGRRLAPVAHLFCKLAHARRDAAGPLDLGFDQQQSSTLVFGQHARTHTPVSDARTAELCGEFAARKAGAPIA
jgi:hypothetical protein